MRRAIRQVAIGALTLPGVAPLLRRLNRDRAVVFMLHRFADPDHDIPGHSPDALRDFLEFLRRHRFTLVHVDEMIRRARVDEDAGSDPAVSFILDDGYWEHTEVAAPIFAEFDAPAAIFPVTGFLDGNLWLWWDRFKTILTLTSHSRVTLDEGLASPVSIALDQPPPQVLRQRRAVEEALKVLPADERDAVLEDLAFRCEVELPTSPPACFRPMSWDDARRCEELGVRMAPHTVTHPILSREGNDRARWEIEESWRRIRSEVEDPIRVFGYPNGEDSDFGPREMRIVKDMGLEGALTARPGYLSLSPLTRANGRGALAPFSVPRYSFPDRFPTFVRIVSGLAGGGVQQLPPQI